MTKEVLDLLQQPLMAIPLAESAAQERANITALLSDILSRSYMEDLESRIQDLVGRLHPLGDTFQNIIRLVGNQSMAERWLKTPNSALDGHTPNELADLGPEKLAQYVVDLLEGQAY